MILRRPEDLQELQLQVLQPEQASYSVKKISYCSDVLGARLRPRRKLSSHVGRLQVEKFAETGALFEFGGGVYSVLAKNQAKSS